MPRTRQFELSPDTHWCMDANGWKSAENCPGCEAVKILSPAKTRDQKRRRKDPVPVMVKEEFHSLST